MKTTPPLITLTKEKIYSRKSGILYEDGRPIIRFLNNPIDVEKLNESTIDYLNRFIEINPDLVQYIFNDSQEGQKKASKPDTIQLNLF